MLRRASIAGLLLALALSLSAAGSTFLALSQEELADQAGAVVKARVAEVRTFWNPERTAILTEARLVVDEVLLGDAPAEVVVRTFGGTVGKYTVEAHGFPKFRSGERQLLYLVNEPKDGSVRVLGYQQGQYRIVAAEDGSELAVPALDQGARLVSPDGRPLPAARALPLAQLEQQIRSAARSGEPLSF